MPGDDTAPGTRRPGLLGSLKNLTSTLVAVAQTRLQLLANEIQEEKLRVAQLGLFAAAAAFFLAFGVLLLTFLVIAFYWDSNRLVAIGAFAAIYLVLGAIFAAVAFQRAHARSHLFEASLRELEKDRERLSA